MDADLVESGRVRLTDEPAPYCIFSRENIPVGDHHVRFDFQLEDGEDVFVALLLSSVDEFAAHLRRLGDEEAEIGDQLHHVYVDDTRGFDCVVCEDNGYVGWCLGTTRFVSPESKYYLPTNPLPFLHAKCYDDFVDGLLGVWDYSDELLSEQL